MTFTEDSDRVSGSKQRDTQLSGVEEQIFHHTANPIWLTPVRQSVLLSRIHTNADQEWDS